MAETSRPRICVIGAGPCGLTAIKNLLAVGLTDVVCYDEGPAIGGNWIFVEDPARTSVYESTHIISSKALSDFEDFPMPADYPDFPSHRQMLAYFESYAAHFKLTPHIRLRARVDEARRAAGGRWVLTVTDAGGTTQETFDHLFICSGHHREAFIPNYPGAFTGETLHSRDYKRPEIFRNKRVLVVGAGNSACDIAVDASRFAERVVLSMRRGAYLVPKILFGRPVDVLNARCRKHLPRWLIQPLFSLMLRLSIGPWEKYGLEPPKMKPFEIHPTLNSSILYALRHGTVLPRPAIEGFDGKRVRFRDGRIEEFDTIVWGTGFKTSFPGLDPAAFDWNPDKPPQLYLKMMHGRIPNIYFLGLFQPIGCIWRLADHQARIAALQIVGRLDRPADIAARIEREVNAPHWRFDATPRHAVEVDYHDFRRELMDELSRVKAA